MLTEISLNVLDIAQNSIKAKASLIEISIEAQTEKDCLTVIIRDNGCGMTESVLKSVIDPFYTTRTTRKVGFGIPFFKQACECTGGQFSIVSQVGKGTTVTAQLVISSIDRMPLGNISETMRTLITMNKKIDFSYKYRVDEREFTLDTRDVRKIMGNIPLDTPEISAYIMEFLEENKKEVDNDIYL